MHVVMNTVLFFAMWIQCVGQVYIVYVPLDLLGHDVSATDRSMDQSYGSCAKDQSKGNVLKGPILWGHNEEPNACTKDQSNGTVHVAATCTYAWSQVRALC